MAYLSPQQIMQRISSISTLRDVYELFVGDMLRVYRLLPKRICALVWLLFGGMLIVATMEVLSLTILAFLGMSVAAPQATSSHPIFRALLSLFPFLGDLYVNPINFVLFVSVIVFLVFMAKNLFHAFVMWGVSRVSELISLHLGSLMLHRFLCSPYIWHISKDSSRSYGALSGRDSMGSMLVQLLSMYTYSLTAFALFITLLSATPAAIFGAILATALIATLVYATIKGRIDRAGHSVMRSAQGQGKSLMDAINGIREVLIYRQQKVFHQAYVTACLEGSKARSFLSIAPPIPTWILESVGMGVIPLSIWVLAMKEGTDLGKVASVISLVMLTAWRILPMVNRVLSLLISVRSMRPQTMVSLAVFEEMRALPTVELPAPDPNFTFNSELALDNICFRYPGAKQDALHGISLTIRKGSQIGFVGLSGAGKSTIVAVLSGLMEPSSGRILTDGKPMGREQFAAYMLRVGYVPQTPYILAGSIADNVAFSQWGQKYDRDRVLRACHMAALDLVEHGAGIDTMVGERGAGLSGGQAQRVSIARALFCDPGMLILDESTSSLDQANEDAIMQTINSYRGSITTVIVAHRLTTLKNCDYLFWLERGQLRDHGPTALILARYKEHMGRLAAAK